MSRQIDANANIYEFMALLEQTPENTAFVIRNNKLVGVATDGDLRRFIHNKKTLPKLVADFMNTEFNYEYENESSNHFHNFWQGILPVVNKEFQIVSEKRGVSHRKNVISAIAPTRITFAGGGSDTEQWMAHSQGKVVNLALAKYARATLSINQKNRLIIKSMNTQEVVSLRTDQYKHYDDEKLRLVVECLKKFTFKEGITIEIYCDFEAGTGLGGSSALVVALLKCLCSYFNIALSEVELIRMAYTIERNDCKIEGGWQDQIAAVKGGLNLINFQSSNFHVYKIDLHKSDLDFLSNSLFICRIGGTRSSSEIHKQQGKKAHEEKFINRMNQIVELADRSFGLIGEGNFSQLGEILDAGWKMKKKLGTFISSPKIDKTYNTLLDLGASGGRLLGAGGGGYLLVYVKPEKQYVFLNETMAQGIDIERVTPDTLGARIISD